MNRFIPDRAGIAQIGRSEDLGEDLEDIAEMVLDQARSRAPVDTGEYRNSLNVVVGIEGAVVVARVNADDDKANLIEFGTIDTPAFHVLTQAQEATGLPVR